MFVATAILSVLLALAFLGAGAIKLIGTKQSLEMREQLRVAPNLWRVIGGLEVAAAAGLCIGLAMPALGVAAAAGLCLLMVGAVAAHARASDLPNAAPAAVLLLLSAATIAVRLASAR
jgi:uncharacterized membrane protein YphA (DoxX/SURF4 family)